MLIASNYSTHASVFAIYINKRIIIKCNVFCTLKNPIHKGFKICMQMYEKKALPSCKYFKYLKFKANIKNMQSVAWFKTLIKK
jgi:hypothetical protein